MQLGISARAFLPSGYVKSGSMDYINTNDELNKNHL
jgi:hypothetical protein